MQSTMNTNLRLPDPLKVHSGDVADNWKWFREQWTNYEVASDLAEASEEKCGAIFLACIGCDAFDVYRTMHFEPAVDRKKIAKLLEAFETFCVGSVNPTYECYMFNHRVQENGERFNVFLDEVRRPVPVRRSRRLDDPRSHRCGSKRRCHSTQASSGPGSHLEECYRHLQGERRGRS